MVKIRIILRVASLFLLWSQMAGCGGPAATPMPEAAQTTFTSERYAYQVTFPEGDWRVTEQEGEWPAGIYLYNWQPGSDMFSGGETSDLIIIGAQPIPADMSLREWADLQLQLFYDVSTVCSPPEHTEELTIGGEPAVLDVFRCPDSFYEVLAAAYHAGQAYHFEWQSSTGNQTDDLQQFKDFLAGLSFTR